MFLKDRSTLSRISLINLPPITNKGREDDRDVGTGETTNLKEVANNQTTLIIMELIPLHITPNVHLDLGRALSC